MDPKLKKKRDLARMIAILAAVFPCPVLLVFGIIALRFGSSGFVWWCKGHFLSIFIKGLDQYVIGIARSNDDDTYLDSWGLVFVKVAAALLWFFPVANLMPFYNATTEEDIENVPTKALSRTKDEIGIFVLVIGVFIIYLLILRTLVFFLWSTFLSLAYLGLIAGMTPFYNEMRRIVDNLMVSEKTPSVTMTEESSSELTLGSSSGLTDETSSAHTASSTATASSRSMPRSVALSSLSASSSEPPKMRVVKKAKSPKQIAKENFRRMLEENPNHPFVKR